MLSEKYSITGMHCAACAAAIERVTKKLPGVTSSEVNLVAATLIITYDEQQLSAEQIMAAVAAAGFSAQHFSIAAGNSHQPADKNRQKTKVIWALICCLPLFYLSMGPMVGCPQPFSGFLSALIQALLALAIIIIHFPIYLGGLKALFHATPNMDSLVAIGSLTAFFYSLYLFFHQIFALSFDSAGMVVSLVALGKYLEKRSMDNTKEAIASLLALTPEMALLIKNGTQLTVRADSLQPGDVVLVKPGATIPADGVVTKGKSTVNEALLTGESLPVEKTVGSQVIDASINQQGMLYIQVTKNNREGTLAQIIDFVESAQAQKAPIARMADKVAAVFVPAVIIIALLSALCWYLLGQDMDFVFKVFTSVLVIACPCAMGLATPTAIVVGTGLGARHGILIRNGQALELISKVTTVVFDKTGTLTGGTPAVSACTAIGTPQKQLWQWAATAEQFSNHPLAEALVQTAKEQNIEFGEVSDYQQLPGLGCKAKLKSGETILIGNRDLFEQEAIAIPTTDTTDGFLVHVAKDGSYMGYFTLEDKLRPTTPAAIKELQTMGKRVLLLSGDREENARKIAAAAGIDQVTAQVKPQDKARIIGSLQAEKQVVMMVGDGINDAPALALADIGCSLASGSDIAKESAHIVLLKNDLRDVARAIKLSQHTIRNIKQNLAWAFCYNILGIPFAAGLFFPLSHELLSPILGALAMSISSICVVLNALRLKKAPL